MGQQFGWDRSPGQSETTVDREMAYQILQNRRRRFTLHHLVQVGKPIPLRALSRQVAAWENGVSTSAVTPQQRKRVYTALHQSHLPKLERMDIVRYDTRQTVVRPTDALETLTVYMDVVPRAGVPWSVRYTAIAAVLCVGALFGWVGIVPAAWYSGHVWAVGTSLLFVVLGLCHRYRTCRGRSTQRGPPPEVSSTDSN
ncbi:hypothetical protein G6M89_17315 [Natronolimnobius sp. AArcel1]|uniref:DUF7344 domain-containing protein n=1 Tax=Natronolimnobius sp. AArcel1 TaxID=1679093 RepID=UPI0013E99F8A|nr:hypothetical protein [Natronolimnobius sp. AArcel1]NGM70744.1 hypothetical protein [Natronolimnobius sp. AArcel1]